MRYSEAHAAKSGSVPFTLPGPKAGRTALSTAIAVIIGLAPALFYASPASAVPAPNDITLSPATATVAEGGTLSLQLVDGSGPTTSNYRVDVLVDNGPYPATVATNTDVSQPSVTTFVDAVLPLAFTVATTQDTLYEYEETFKIVVTDVTASLVVYSRVVTINDDDSAQAPTYALTASPTSVTEAASAKATITATLNKASGRDTVVTVNTVDNSATATYDYSPQVGSLITINAGALTGTLDIDVANDGFKDAAATENFTVVGSATNVAAGGALTSLNVSIADAQAALTPKLTITGGDASEAGNSTFTVTATPGSELPIGAQWSSVDTTPATGHGTATAGVDFTYPGTRTVSITPRTLTTTIVIPLTTDTMDEPDEDFTVALASPTNAELGTPSTKTATITDLTGAPTIVTILPAAVDEGNSGTKVATFTATLSAASAKTVQADWSTTDGTATSALDFVAGSGTLTFAPGVTTQTFAVSIIGDTIDEDAGETFTVSSTSTDGSLAASGPTTVTITDDDAKPTLTLPAESILEGNDAWAKLVPVKLSNASSTPISFTLTATSISTTSDTLTATVGSGDYSLLNSAVSGMTIPAGQMTGYAVVLVNGDTIYEPNEAVDLTATATTNAASLASGSPATGRLTLGNDDKAPDLEINSATGKEGETVKVTGTVTGVSQDNTTLTVSFAGKAADDNKAASADDFTNPGAQVVTITAGGISGSTRTIANIPLINDTTSEPAESIVGSGTGLGGVGTVTDGVIVIEASDGDGVPEEPAEAPKPTISAPDKVVGPQTVEIEGEVAAHKQVELWGAPVGGGSLKWIKNGDSDGEGHYWFEHPINWGFRFAVQSQDKKSDDATVWIVQKPLFVVSTSTKGQLNLGVRGTPWAAGQTAAVQRWTNAGWNTVWSGKTGADAVWRGSAKFASGSKIVLRGWVGGQADRGTMPAFTAQQIITVR